MKNIALKKIPSDPGVYLFKDLSQKIIYIGKAKNLKKRVSSYFQKQKNSLKIYLLQKNIVDVEYYTTQNEIEAFILESNLIKKHQPKYNIQLKDDKHYSFIGLSLKRSYPQIFKTRSIKDAKKNRYFGPYPYSSDIKKIFETIKTIFKIRSCRLNIPFNETPCLFYHSPCYFPFHEKKTISSDLYKKNYIEPVLSILKGSYKEAISLLKKQMFEFSSKLLFEEAQKIKEMILTLKKIESKQVVFISKKINVDIWGYFLNKDKIHISILFIKDGKWIEKRSFNFKKELSSLSKNFENFFKDYYRNSSDFPHEIIVPFKINSKQQVDFFFSSLNKKLKVVFPYKGLKKNWLDMAMKNSKIAFLGDKKNLLLSSKNKNSNKILLEAQKVLNINQIPKRIEGFDISNTKGIFAFASLVCFVDGKAFKKDYRLFSIKSLKENKANDVQSIQEAVYRRYFRLKRENKTLPNLILIDGGKPQVNAAYKALEFLGLSIPILGLAKKNEEIFFPKEKNPLCLDKKSEVLKLLQNVRDEAHRFANKNHSLKAKKRMLYSFLEKISGIGKKKALLILKHLNYDINLQSISLEEIENIKGLSSKDALNVYNFFNKIK